MTRNLFISLFTLLCFQSIFAQNITGKVIDSKSGENLSHANIQINGGESVVSNSEGYFTIPEKSAEDALLTISFLGYKTVNVTFNELKALDFIIRLQPGIFELETVYLTNANMNADSIMAAVKKNLAINYKSPQHPLKNTIFYRETTAFKPIKLDAVMTQSTGYRKKELKDANAGLKAFTNKIVSHPSQQFTDMLCNYYTDIKKVDDKLVYNSKFEVVKAVKIKDRSKSVGLDEVQKMAGKILFTHLDSTKYYRIKSGLFGTRDTVISRNDFFGSKKDKVKKDELVNAKTRVTMFMANASFQGYRLDFVRQYQKYEFTYAGAIQNDKNEFVYIIKFKPKKRQAKYAGTLYVQEKDYAIIRAEYALAEGKKLSGINLKFLLGVKQSENVSRGTLIFKERAAGEGYYLQYGSVENGEYMYINRPLKFIEITDGEKDKLAFDLKIEANTIDKEEYLSMSQSEISQTGYDNAKEPQFDYINLKSYDPSIWKEYSAIEPLEEMKQFKAIE